MANVSISGGSSEKPLLVDTGSSTIAFCNETDMGDSTPLEQYGCSSYGEAGSSPNGWVGQLYNTSLAFGTGNETVSDPLTVQAFKVKDENTNICTKYVRGILGVDLGLDYLYGEPKPLYPLDKLCDGEASDELPGQFASSMLTSKDSYTYGFHGLSPVRDGGLGLVPSYAPVPVQNPTDSVISFGETTHQRVKNQESLGKASFTSSGYNNITGDAGNATWYTFVDDVTYTFVGLGNETDCEDVLGWDYDDCYYTVSNNGESRVVIDSGTQELEIPANGWPETTDDTVLIINIGDGVELTFDAETLNSWNQKNPYLAIKLVGPGSDNPNLSPTLGFPVFWRYDIVFDVSIDKVQEGTKRYGDVTFYERPTNEDGLDIIPSPADPGHDTAANHGHESTAGHDHPPADLDHDSTAVLKGAGLLSLLAAAFVAGISI